MSQWLVIAACVYLGWAVWARRWTLRPSCERLKLTERTITASLILQLCALVLMSPWSAPVAGRALHAVFNHWNLNTFVGHCLYIGAAGLIGANAGSRVDISEEKFRTYFRCCFALPMTVVVPVLLALIVKSPNADRETPDFFRCPLDGWLMAYWVILCGFIAFILAYTADALLIVRTDSHSRVTATIYLVGCGLGIIVCLTRVVTVGTSIDFSGWFWLLDSLLGIAFAYGSSRSWRNKIRQLGVPAKL